MNYAWHVNRLPYSLCWQGDPAGFGSPIHPARQVMTNPPMFEFAEPFHVTYPLFFNPPYFYDGYSRFFSLKSQVIGTARASKALVGTVLKNPLCYVLAIVLWLFFQFSTDRKTLLSWTAKQWHVYLPALGGIALYLPVHLEDR